MNKRIAKKVGSWPLHPESQAYKGAPSKNGRVRMPYTRQQWVKAHERWRRFVRNVMMPQLR